MRDRVGTENCCPLYLSHTIVAHTISHILSSTSLPYCYGLLFIKKKVMKRKQSIVHEVVCLCTLSNI